MNDYEQNIEIMKDLRARIDKVLQDQPEQPATFNIQPKDTSKGHFYVSLAKSFLRITAGVTLALAGFDPDIMTAWLKVSGAFFIAAECLGILEEMV